MAVWHIKSVSKQLANKFLPVFEQADKAESMRRQPPPLFGRTQKRSGVRD
jgi:hypothetical protein